MGDYDDLYVAHYGHPSLPGAKHWAIVVMTKPQQLTGVSYQISGSAYTYSVKEPEDVSLLHSNTYLGRVKVGMIPKGWQYATGDRTLHAILTRTQVVRGNLQWHCQHWVVAALARLRKAGYAVDDLSLQDLQQRLHTVRREDQS